VRRWRAQRRLATVIVMTATLAGAGRLHAAPRDPKAVARAKLVEGAELLSRGEYEEALARFQDAYARVPSPKIFYNYGLAYKGLGRNAEAIAAFDRFLAEAGDAGADKRSDAERRRAELLKRVGTLEITSEVEGADILIDGTSYGQTPRSAPIYLDSGNHLLSVRKGKLQHVQRLTTERGAKQTIVVALSENTPPPLAMSSSQIPLPTPPAPEAPHGADIAPPSEHSSTTRVVAWSTAAASVVLLTGGVVETVVASHKLDEFNSTLAPDGSGRSCGTDRPDFGGGVCRTLHDDWNLARTLGYAGLIGGGVLAAASITLFVVSNDSHRQVACAPAPGALGVTCAGRF
jgi:hypothetical protein